MDAGGRYDFLETTKGRKKDKKGHDKSDK